MQLSPHFLTIGKDLYVGSYMSGGGGGVGHDVIKILNFSAMQCKFNRYLNNCLQANGTVQ